MLSDDLPADLMSLADYHEKHPRAKMHPDFIAILKQAANKLRWYEEHEPEDVSIEIN